MLDSPRDRVVRPEATARDCRQQRCTLWDPAIIHRPPSMRPLLDGDEALPLQALKDRECRRQQLTAFAVVSAATCDRRLDGDDQELGRHPFVIRLHCHARSLRRRQRDVGHFRRAVDDAPRTPARAGATSANGALAAAHPIAFASSILVDRLSTKAAVAGGKSVTCSAEPPPTSWPL